AKRVALLKKKVEKDKARIERARAAAGSRSEREKLAAAEAAFGEKIAALKGGPDGFGPPSGRGGRASPDQGPAGPDSAALDAAEQAITELDSAIGEAKSGADSKAAKKHLLDLKKRMALARATIKTKRGEVRFVEHRAQVEAALAAAREKVSALDGGDA